MSRAIQGTYVWFEDDETRDYVASQLALGSRRRDDSRQTTEDCGEVLAVELPGFLMRCRFLPTSCGAFNPGPGAGG